MEDIGSVGNVNPRAQKLYEQEFRHGAALFEKALVQANKSSYAPQQEQFSGVMQMAMEVLNQSARALKRADLIKQSDEISKDFANYSKDPSKEHFNVLKRDLETAKKSLQ